VYKNRYRFIRPQFSLGVIGLIIGLTACPTPSTAPEPGFSLKLLAGGVQVIQGSSAELEVSLNRDRFTDPITVTASELPAGITAGTVTTTGTVVKLRFAATLDAIQGDAKPVTVFATAGGKVSEVARASISVRGAPGALDTTFGGTGRLNFRSSGDDRFIGVALAPDGKMVMVISNFRDSLTTVLRLNPDGTTDPTLRKRLNLASGRETIGGVAVQPDGKIVLAGGFEGAQTSQFSLGVARLTAQGALDSSFSDDGIFTLPVPSASVGAVTLAPDGSIVVAGSSFNGTDRDFLLTRVTSDGRQGFGGNGFRTDSFGTSNDVASSVAVQADGSIILAGRAQTPVRSQFVLARYRADGVKDSLFGQLGHVIVEFNDEINSAAASALAVQPDGNIVTAGFANSNSSTGLRFAGMGVARLLTNGKPDLSFSSDGTLILGEDQVSGMTLEPNGRILIGGFATGVGGQDFALTRLEPNGKLDLGFGIGGRQVTDFGGTDDRVVSLLLAGDGRLILAGSSDGDIAFARYWQ
jgi:uncharacterized delta-60 repeat protein